MTTPIVGVQKENYIEWQLPNGIVLEEYHLCVSPDIEVRLEGVLLGRTSKELCERKFGVILYPPGSVPSPERSEPGHKEKMKALGEFFAEDTYEYNRGELK